MSPVVSAATRRLEVGRRYTRRRHHEDLDGEALADIEQPVNAVGSQHVGDFVRIGDYGRGPVREHHAHELVDHELGRLDVHVSVDESRDEIEAGGVDALASVEFSESGNAAVRNRDIGIDPFLGESGEDMRTGNHQIGRLVSARPR